jgi:hypothetical protein
VTEPRPFPMRSSSIKEFLSCPRKAAYKYLESRTYPERGVTAIGTAGHAGVEYALLAKIATGALPPLDEVRAVAAEKARELAPAVDWTAENDIDLGSLVDWSVLFATHYVEHVAPSLRPVAIERKFAVDVAGIRVTGTRDLDCADETRDLKTTSRLPSPWGEPAHRFQGGLYTLSRHAEADGYGDPLGFSIDYLVRSETKKDGRKVKHLRVYLEPADAAAEAECAASTIMHVDDMATAGNFPRNPTACAEWGRSCEFMRECMPHRASAAERAAAAKRAA